MIVKIQDYFYHDNFDKENEKYNAPVLDIKARDENLKPHIIQVLDKENLAPHFGVLSFAIKPILELEELPKEIVDIDYDTPDSLFGETTVGLKTTFPFEVGRIKKNFSQTFVADVKWEKMAMSEIIRKRNLKNKYIDIPDNYVYKYLKVDDINPVPKELFFPVKDHIFYWDIESDSRDVNHDIRYEDYKKMPVISIAGFDNYKEDWHIFVWHPNFIRKETRFYKELNIESQDLILKNVYIHEVLSEEEVLKEFFTYFGKNKFDRMMGFWSCGGIMKQSFKGSVKREWRDGFDIQCVYARTEELGLVEEIQKMSPCPFLKKHWGNSYEGVYLRQNGSKHEVVIKGVGQIDFLVSNDVLNFAQKDYSFRGHKLADWMEYFLEFKKLDKGGEAVYYYWLQKDLSSKELDEAEIINGVPRVNEKGLDFMIKYNLIDVYGVVELDERFNVSERQANRTDVSISPFADALHTSKLHDHYKLTHYQNKYMFDTKYQNNVERIIDGKKQIGVKFTITLEELERQAQEKAKKSLEISYKSLDDIHKVGGFVPKTIDSGIYENVIVIDFSKFYPNMIKTCNIGVVSAINVDHYDDEYVWDKNGKKWNRRELIETPLSFFRKDVKSINTQLFDDWMKKRVKAQKELSNYLEVHKTTKTDRYNFLWTEQFNIKNFMNGGFGVLGLPIDRIYWRKGFNNTTVSCQDVIMFCINLLDEWEIKKLLGDTDSAFIFGKGETLQELIDYGKNVCDRLNKEIKRYMQNVYNIEPEDNYIKIGMETISDKFYVESKKHYIKRNIYVEGVILDKPELEIKGMDLKKRATSQIGADNQMKLINFIFEEKDPLDSIIEYISEIDSNLKSMDWSYVCKRAALNKELDKYPPNNQSATGARNMLRLFGKYYKPGSNPFLGVFSKFPPEINGKFINGKTDFVLSFDEEDIPMLKESGFELNYEIIKETQCDSKTKRILSLFGEDWDSLLEKSSLGEMMLV